MKDFSKQYQTIGIIGWGLLGDVLMRTPVVHAIRQIFPNAKITVIVDSIGEEIFRHNLDVDEIFLFDRKNKPKWKYVINKITGMLKVRNHKFDLLIDLYSSKSSANLLMLSGASYRIGFTHSHLTDKTYNLPFPDEFKRASSHHLSRGLLKVVSIFGYDFEEYDIRPRFLLRNDTQNTMAKYLAEFNLTRTYVLNLGSGGTEKILPMEKSFQQVKFLYEKYNYTPLIVCNPGQEYLQQQFVNDYMIPSMLPYGALRKLSLEEIGSVMSLSNFIVTPDTGLYHLAVAIDLPLFGIFTCTSLTEVKPENGLYIQYLDQSDSSSEHLLQRTEEFVKLLEEKNQ